MKTDSLFLFLLYEYKLYIKECKEIMEYEIYEYVIMDNHYHIVVRAHEVYLSKIMHRINYEFSKYYNLINNSYYTDSVNQVKRGILKLIKYL